MPNVAAVLKDEITRLAKKQVRLQLAPLKQSNQQLRKSMASLKRENAELQRRVARLEKGGTKRASTAAAPAGETGGAAARFSPKWVASDRRRLGLSAREYGLLIGVSHITVYNWEKGKSRPRAKPLAAWAAVRGMGKREALRRLDELEDA